MFFRAVVFDFLTVGPRGTTEYYRGRAKKHGYLWTCANVLGTFPKLPRARTISWNTRCWSPTPMWCLHPPLANLSSTQICPLVHSLLSETYLPTFDVWPSKVYLHVITARENIKTPTVSPFTSTHWELSAHRPRSFPGVILYGTTGEADRQQWSLTPQFIMLLHPR